MAPPRRRVRPPARALGSGRLGSLLFGIGCLVVLGVTFALGVSAGRRWPNSLPLPGLRTTPALTSAPRDVARRYEGRGLDKDKTKTLTEAPPVLTFYRELTAPLTSPPPTTRTAAKPERVEKPKPATSGEAAESPRPESAPPASAPAAKPGSEGRLTVQVGAFKIPAPAEALRVRLAQSGQGAYVAEAEVDGVTQYRVRVGSFSTRAAANDAAARLASEWRLATYVTTR